MINVNSSMRWNFSEPHYETPIIGDLSRMSLCREDPTFTVVKSGSFCDISQ